MIEGAAETRAIGWMFASTLLGACAIGSGGENPFGPGGVGGSATTTTQGSGEDADSDDADDDNDSGSGIGGGSAGDGADTDTDDPPPPPGTEVCNGLDDDDDGEIDEDQPDVTCGVGSCEVTEPSCVGGVPQMCTPALPGAEVCNNLDDDCDGTIDNDTEQGCSTACGNGVIACVGGVEQACDAPPVQAETCNLDDDDCDGDYDEGVAGCRVGVHRSYNGATDEHFYTTDIGEAQCCGFNLEVTDFYHLYQGSQPGLNAFYRCIKGNGKHFYTQNATCEGQTVEFVMGYIATAEDVAGSVPLYRLYRPATGNHFYTTSAAEVGNAIMNLGYVDEGVAGYVW